MADSTEKRIAEIEALAKAATQGAVYATFHDMEAWRSAANPEAILRLIAALKAAEADHDRLREALNRIAIETPEKDYISRTGNPIQTGMSRLEIVQFARTALQGASLAEQKGKEDE